MNVTPPTSDPKPPPEAGPENDTATADDVETGLEQANVDKAYPPDWAGPENG